MDFIENQLTYEIYVELRSSVGWLNFDEEQTRKAVGRSLYTVTVEAAGKPIAMGRVVGDGIYYTVVDVVVRPECQKRGIGSKIIDMILEYVEKETPSGGRSSVQLIAEKGKEGFYIKKGFQSIPHEFCGAGMRKIIRK